MRPIVLSTDAAEPYAWCDVGVYFQRVERVAAARGCPLRHLRRQDLLQRETPMVSYRGGLIRFLYSAREDRDSEKAPLRTAYKNGRIVIL